jgi:hypothetical protein
MCGTVSGGTELGNVDADIALESAGTIQLKRQLNH